MWLHKPPEYLLPTLVVHPEHIRDRLRDGWTECPDPTAQPEPEKPCVITQDTPAPVKRIADAHATNNAARAAFAEMGMGPKPKSTRARR